MPARCSLDSAAAGDVSDFFVFVCARATRPSSPGSQPRRTAKEGDAGARIKSSSPPPTVCRAGTCCPSKQTLVRPRGVHGFAKSESKSNVVSHYRRHDFLTASRQLV